jgi:hypothetical protein
MTEELLKHNLQLCVSKNETHVNSLSQDTQRHTAISQEDG